MKLTQRGRDYLKAVIIFTLVASVLDVNIILVLAFTLSVVAVIAFLIVSSITKYNIKMVVKPATIRCFKKDELVVNTTLIFKRSRWINVVLSSIQAEQGINTKMDVKGNTAKITMSTSYAGSFSGLTFHLEVIDILNLFSKRIHTIYSDFVYEALPLSILTPIPRSKPMPLALGEKSGRSPGSSLELYALEEYQPFTETKNVMWKRVARMPDESLIVRVRDSSVPSVMRIAFVQNQLRHEQEKLDWMDLTCEAIGTIGNSLLAVGCIVEIVHTTQQNQEIISIHEVSNLDELCDALMHLSEPPIPGENMQNLFQIIDKSDIVICGMHDMDNPMLCNAISKKRTIAIAEKKASPVMIGQQTMIYTGVEDIRKLMSRVLEI